MGGRDDGNQSGKRRPNRQDEAIKRKMAGAHRTGLTPSLLELFEPRPPVEFKEPIEKKKNPAYTGIAQFLNAFAEPGDPEYAPPTVKVESREEKKARITALKLEKGAQAVAEELPKYNPKSDPNARGDPYKTLFVARLCYDTSEGRIKREFERYGSVRRVRLVVDKLTGKSRGYAFVEFYHTSDMKEAYRRADGMKIDNRRILVDVERSRTVRNWIPQRLGGGLGHVRDSTEPQPQVQAVSRDRNHRNDGKHNDGKHRDNERHTDNKHRDDERHNDQRYHEDERHNDRKRKRERDSV